VIVVVLSTIELMQHFVLVVVSFEEASTFVIHVDAEIDYYIAYHKDTLGVAVEVVHTLNLSDLSQYS